MKICYIADGSSIHVTEWVGYFQKKGHEVTIISDTNCHIDNIQVYSIGDCLPKIRIPILSAIIQIQVKVRKIRKILKNIHPDIIHAHYATNYGFLATKTGFQPYILTCHGSDILVDLNKSISFRYFVRKAVKNADYITFPSEEILNKLSEIYPHADRLLMIQYGVDLQKFKPGHKDSSLTNIISTRNLSEKYRIDVLIHAIPRIVQHHQNIKCTLIGDGTERKEYENLSEYLKIRDYIEFAGHIKHDDIPGYYARSQIYVTTSPTDGISISLLEAFASGCYPVVPDNPSNRSLKTMGFEMSLYGVNKSEELAEAIISVINRYNSNKGTIQKNLDLVKKHFSRATNMDKINSIYESFKKEL